MRTGLIVERISGKLQRNFNGIFLILFSSIVLHETTQWLRWMMPALDGLNTNDFIVI